MYDYLRDVLNLADIVKDVDRTINAVDMGRVGESLDRIKITGTTGGKPFELTLEVGEWKLG